MPIDYICSIFYYTIHKTLLIVIHVDLKNKLNQLNIRFN